MYDVKYASERILKKVKNFPKSDRKQIIKAIDSKLKNYTIFTQGIKYIKNHNRYRLRVGNYRVIFSKEKKIITVHNIEDRKEAYKPK